MTYRHLLVPIDGSPLGTVTVEGAVALARSLGARVTFFHASADFSATSDGALLRSLDPSAFAEAAQGNARAILAKAEASARAGGVAAASVCVSAERPDEAILDVAQGHACDLIYLASHGRRGLKAAWQGSVVQRLMHRTSLPVLIAAIESNLPASAEQRALTTIRDEHRSLAAVIHALQQVCRSAVAANAAPDFSLLQAMLFYIEKFPERLHHPKEEAHLFAALGKRTNGCDALIQVLRQQHAEGAHLFAVLHCGLADWQAGAIDGTVFAQSVEAFAQAQWEHMRIEEQLVMPAASLHLTTQDWEAIAAAFHDNADPRFGADADEPFAALCARLLNMAAVGAAGTPAAP